MKKIGIAVLCVCLVCIVAFARQYSDVECNNEKCEFKGEIGEGPTRTRDWVSGYCSKCDKFVWQNWDRNGVDPKPPEMFKVWDPESGKTRELFACPHCKELVFAIKEKSELKFCPKCNSAKIKISEPHKFKD